MGNDAVLEGVFSTISEYSGDFLNERGKLSSSFIVLEDNVKYQQFSYVIKTSESITLWGDLLKSLIHPAGFGVFSETVIPINIQLPEVISTTYNNQTSVVTVATNINAIYRQYTSVSNITTISQVGYNQFDTLRKLIPNIPPLKTIEQINLDSQDSVYSGVSDYNYSGTANVGYWITVTNADDINTLTDKPWNDFDFLGSIGSIDYRPRNFIIENYYTNDELLNGVSFANKPIFLPDSTIKIY